MLLLLGEEAVPVDILNFMYHDLKIENYVACTHEFDWYAGPFVRFKWPLKEDECWVALSNIIKVLKPPKSNQSGRNFTFDENDIKDVISIKN